ncbi:hypothetical protein [Pinisolibacter sp.]|uniref:hypothetical protein n=1 Tax=Pinisolibacter sp. TaxID=2172024 RepID=UPI002FDD5E32
MQTRSIPLLATLLALTLPFAIPAAAGELTPLAEKAEAALAAGKAGAAVDALDAALDVVWKATPLTFRKALFVSEPPTGFGAYVERADAVFTPGQPLLVYAEPIGFEWKQADGLFTCDLIIDVALRDPAGKVLFEKREIGRMALKSHARNHEFMMKLDLNLRGLPVGDYVLDGIMRDEVSKKWGSFSLPFSVKG